MLFRSVWATLDDSEKAKRPYPLISGDVGPYAAYLANGSEYTGDYGQITIKELKEFHRPRIQILLDQGVDLLALETIPNRLEAQALIELLAEEFSEAEAYISFTVQEPKKPTCTEAGNKAYYRCETCGKLYLDKDGKNETTQIGRASCRERV